MKLEYATLLFIRKFSPGIASGIAKSFALSLVISSCAVADTFSQYPGFADYFADHPPASQAANESEQALLRRYRPRLWIGPDQDAPIGFYPDYIAHGTLYDGKGNTISTNVDQALLNAHKHEPDDTFAHRTGSYETHPVVFARVDHARLDCTPTYTFLTYNFVFRDSGLPAGLAFWQEWPLRLIANLDDWHQLDHYTAASVVLGPDQRPVALVLQQHNGQRSYIFGEDIDLPADDRVRLTAALRSNELYPWAAKTQRHRVVQYMNEKNFRYMVTGKDKPFYAADDITDAKREIEYKLGFLPHDDAFYVFQGSLGEHRSLPGRDGPPGAAYHTLPIFMNRALQLVAFHWREGDTDQMQALIDFTRASRADGNAATDSKAFRTLCTQFMRTLRSRTRQ